MNYLLALTPDDNDTFMVTCPQLPEVATFGVDFEDARKHGADAIEEALSARILKGRPSIDADAQAEMGRKQYDLVTDAPVPALTLLKVKLYDAMRKEGVTRAELARRLGWNRESVDRLFRLDHASRLEQIDAASGALGCYMVVGMVPDPGVGGQLDWRQIAAEALSLVSYSGPWPRPTVKDPKKGITPAAVTTMSAKAGIS